MSVERITRKSGTRVYRVRWREHGRNRARAFDRRPDAEAWDREVKRRQQLGPLAVEQLTDRRVTLAEWIIDRWTPEHGVTLARSTREAYAAVHGRHIAPALDGLPLRDITVGVLRRWQADLIASGVRPGAIVKARTFLSSVLRHAAEAEAILANPLPLVRAPRAPHREQTKSLAPATVERIRARLGVRDATLVSVLAYAGLRPGEALALRWGDVRERTILVQRASDGYGGVKTTKTRSARTVRLLAPLAADLREWRLASGSSGRWRARLSRHRRAHGDARGVDVDAPDVGQGVEGGERWARGTDAARLRPPALVCEPPPRRGPCDPLRGGPGRPRCTAHSLDVRAPVGRVRRRRPHRCRA